MLEHSLFASLTPMCGKLSFTVFKKGTAWRNFLLLSLHVINLSHGPNHHFNGEVWDWIKIMLLFSYFSAGDFFSFTSRHFTIDFHACSRFWITLINIELTTVLCQQPYYFWIKNSRTRVPWINPLPLVLATYILPKTFK